MREGYHDPPYTAYVLVEWQWKWDRRRRVYVPQKVRYDDLGRRRTDPEGWYRVSDIERFVGHLGCAWKKLGFRLPGGTLIDEDEAKELIRLKRTYGRPRRTRSRTG